MPWIPFALQTDLYVQKISLNEEAKKKYLDIIQQFEKDIIKPEYQEKFIKIGASN